MSSNLAVVGFPGPLGPGSRRRFALADVGTARLHQPWEKGMNTARQWFEQESERLLPRAIFDRITAEYDSSQRFYHNVSHLIEMARFLKDFQDRLVDYDACLIACLYHDVVYDTRAHDNESRSEQKFRADIAGLRFDAQTVAKASSLILSTKKHLPLVNDIDHAVFLDADLAILGAKRDRYQDYMNSIRREYAWVAEADYKKGRSGVLKQFLSKEQIYFTEETQSRIEFDARQNIEYELEVLKTDRTLRGTLSKTAEGRVCYEIYYAKPDIVHEVSKILTNAFGFAEGSRTAGPDQVIGEWLKGDTKLLWGYDNWSGFYFFADSSAGDQWVKEIGAHLDPLLEKPEFAQYTHYW